MYVEYVEQLIDDYERGKIDERELYARIASVCNRVDEVGRQVIADMTREIEFPINVRVVETE